MLPGVTKWINHLAKLEQHYQQICDEGSKEPESRKPKRMPWKY
jgi:hypothetical protein